MLGERPVMPPGRMALVIDARPLVDNLGAAVRAEDGPVHVVPACFAGDVRAEPPPFATPPGGVDREHVESEDLHAQFGARRRIHVHPGKGIPVAAPVEHRLDRGRSDADVGIKIGEVAATLRAGGAGERVEHLGQEGFSGAAGGARDRPGILPQDGQGAEPLGPVAFVDELQIDGDDPVEREQ